MSRGASTKGLQKNFAVVHEKTIREEQPGPIWLVPVKDYNLINKLNLNSALHYQHN